MVRRSPLEEIETLTARIGDLEGDRQRAVAAAMERDERLAIDLEPRCEECGTVTTAAATRATDPASVPEQLPVAFGAPAAEAVEKAVVELWPVVPMGSAVSLLTVEAPEGHQLEAQLPEELGVGCADR